jgi:hypothetical protein
VVRPLMAYVSSFGNDDLDDWVMLRFHGSSRVVSIVDGALRCGGWEIGVQRGQEALGMVK